MATRAEGRSRPGRLPSTWDAVLAGRPLVPLVVVWLTTAGHTMNFHEMGGARGWVSAELYSLHTVLALGIALTLLACPTLGRYASAGSLTQAGLLLLAAASFLNGLYVQAPFEVFLAGRAAVAIGAGLVIAFAPRLLDDRWESPTTWASILLPVVGPGVIAAASMSYGWSEWESGFLIEGVAALFASLVLFSMADVPESPPTSHPESIAFLPWLAIGTGALVFVLHWGQLYGWSESTEIVLAAAVVVLGLGVALVLAWHRIDLLALRESWIRLLLYFFGGACQWLQGTTMNVYGGLMLNFSSWQRSLLVWTLPLGVATSLIAARLILPRWRIRPGLPGAIAGLLLLAVGMYHSYEHTLDWPYWQIQNTADLNWFPAPEYWQLAPDRWLMGLGTGLFLVSMDMMGSGDPAREKRFHPYLAITQFYGGGLGIALLVNFFLIGHPVHYSYAADRDFIQAQEIADRREVLRETLHQAGELSPERQADVLLFRWVNYEADNLVFADIYASFAVAATALAVVCSGLLVWNGLYSARRAQAR